MKAFKSFMGFFSAFGQVMTVVMAVLAMGLVITGWLLTATILWAIQPGGASNSDFSSPYGKETEALSSYYTRYDGQKAFAAENIPDGQLHWLGGNRIPGIDIKNSHTQSAPLYNPCPDYGLAWSLVSGDALNVGSGGNKFVAIECQGQQSEWQVILFHVQDVLVKQSKEAGNRVFTKVEPGQIVALEGNHTHYALGYWGVKQNISCNQYNVAQRWWVNAATCKPIVQIHLDNESAPQQARDPTGYFLVTATIPLLAILNWLKGKTPGWIIRIFAEYSLALVCLMTVGPPPWEFRQAYATSNYTAVEPHLPSDLAKWAQANNIGEQNLLANIYASTLCWSQSIPGVVVSDSDENCTKVDLELLLAIDAVESSTHDYKWYDPTKPGPMGWEMVEVTAYRRWGQSGGRQQLEVIWEIMTQPEMLRRYPNAITDLNDNGVYEPEAGDRILVYGSSATCIGRSQGLPSSIKAFAKTALADKSIVFDPWNDEISSAVFKAAHLAWNYKGSTLWEKRRNAVFAYNPNGFELEWAGVTGFLGKLSRMPAVSVSFATKSGNSVDMQGNANSNEYSALSADRAAKVEVPYAVFVTETPLQKLAQKMRNNPQASVLVCMVSAAYARPCTRR